MRPYLGLALAILVVFTGSPHAQDGAGPLPAGGRAVAHRSGRLVLPPSKQRLPSARLYDTGLDAGEPTLGHTSDGSTFFVAVDVDAQPIPSQVSIVRSADQGTNWQVVSPRVGPLAAHPITFDPYLWVDPDTDRLFTIDLTNACSLMSFSDDRGETWTTNPLACGRPVNDHQTLFGGPPVTSPVMGYENVLYYCWNDVLSSSCSKSLDGGLKFIDTGAPAFVGYEPGSDQPGISGIQGFCTGLHGHGVVGRDGTVYLPRAYCNRASLAISHDEGLTWKVVQTSTLDAINQTGGGGANTSVAVDEDGDIYYLFVALKDRLPYLTVSRDDGETWSKPVNVAAPGVVETNFPTIDVGAPGKVAIAYYGSENSPGEPWNESYIDTTWNAYMTMSIDVLSKRPTFMSASLNPRSDPLVRDRCGPGRCRTVLDFIDVEIAPDGTPWAALVDSCTASCAAITGRNNVGDRGLLGRLVGGPSLN